MEKDLFNKIIQQCRNECPDFVPQTVCDIETCDAESVIIKFCISIKISSSIVKLSGVSQTANDCISVRCAIEAINEELLSKLDNL